MTLILNEIHLLDGLSKTMLVAAGDSRISRLDGAYHDTRQKLFLIPKLNATISYFGLAVFTTGSKNVYLADILQDFISKQSEVPDLETFAQDLRDELHHVIRGDILQNYPSGFHICGYNRQGLPDFWHFSNIGDMQGFRYLDLRTGYFPPSPDFLGRDAEKFGWDGRDPSSARNGVQSYRNGDFRAHVAVWERLDESLLKGLFQFPDFKRPSNPHEYGQYVKFKFKVIAYIYKNWAKKEIIAPPVGVIVLHNLGGEIETIEL